MPGEYKAPPRRASSYAVTAALVVGLLVLGASFVVLATSWTFDYPDDVLFIAWNVGFAASIVVAITAWISAQRSGLGFFESIWKTLRVLGRFVLEFFIP